MEFSLGSEVSFIWGPPGTGKTHTLARLLGEFLEQGKRVLVTSTTNGAVDTVIDKMIELNLAKKIRKRGEMARLGRPHGLHEEVNIDAVLNRINRDILEKIKKHQEEQNIILGRVTLLTEFMGFLEQANDQIGLFGPSDSSIREEEILRELKKSLPSYWDDFSVQKKKDYIKEAIDEKSKELALKQNQLKSHKENLIKDPKAVVNRSRLLFSTLASLYTGNMLEGELFDVVVVEEAGMAVLPALFYSLTRAKEKAVLVGDPMQLPSVVQSQNSFVKRAMGRSIYQVGLEDDFSNDTVHLLDTQYRMHPIIGDMISKLFYSGRLINGISPESRKEISSLNPAPGQPFGRIDLKGKSLCQRKEGSSSRFNQVSAEICLDLLKDIPERFTIALITPYADQSRLLNDMIRDEIKNRDHIECSTVHRFQGQERDVVILDLTDSEPLNPGMLVTGEYGRNLLNVALSRARGKLIVLSERSYFTERAPGTAIEALLKYDLT